MVVDVSHGNFVPVTALLGGSPSYIVDGIAQSDCELVAIEIIKLRKLLLEDAGVSNCFLEISLQRLQRISSWTPHCWAHQSELQNGSSMWPVTKMPN